MRKTLRSFLPGLLCVSMLLGCFACKGNEQSGEDSTEQGTDAPTVEQVDRNKPQTGPFSNTTDLSFEKQTVTETEKVVSEEYEYSSDGGSMVFTVGEGRAKGDIVSLNANTVANFNIGVKFNENVVAKYAFKLLSSAPNDRFNYRYTTVQSEVKTPECLAEDMIVLKAGSYYAFAGGKQVRLDASSTKATLMGRGNEFYLPKTFVEEVIGVSCEGLTTYDHYGITYVMPAEAIAAAGKAITITAEGLVVISTTAIEDGDVLTTLYRALM